MGEVASGLVVSDADYSYEWATELLNRDYFIRCDLSTISYSSLRTDIIQKFDFVIFDKCNFDDNWVIPDTSDLLQMVEDFQPSIIISRRSYEPGESGGGRIPKSTYYEALINTGMLNINFGAYNSLEDIREHIFQFKFGSFIDHYLEFKKSNKSIRKSIEFTKEHRQAGIQILNYFKETLDEKYPDNEVSVKIGQEGNKVMMEITSKDGEIERYEEALEDYGLVVIGQKPVEDYLDNRIDQERLHMKLEMAALEIRNLDRMLGIEREAKERALDEVSFLRSQLSPSLQSLNRIAVDAMVSLTSETGHFAKILELAEKAMASDEGVKKLVAAFEADLQAGEKEQVAQDLQTLEEKKPGILKRIWAWSGSVATKGAEKAVSGELGDLIQQMT